MSGSRLILHVGWPKTATTSMQAGITRFPNLAGKPFGHALTDRAVPTIDAIVRSQSWSPNDLDSLIAAARSHADLPVFLSEEVLIAMPQREWFDNLVGPFEVANRLARTNGEKQVFFTLREPRQHLRSTWLHHVREGRTQSYPLFLDRIAADRARNLGTFAIAALVDRYGELFGYENLVVGFTDAYASDPCEFWRRFGDAFGVPQMDTYFTPDGPWLNRTVLGPIMYELAVNRILNTYGQLRRSEDIRPLRRRMTRKISFRIPSSHANYFARHSGIEDWLVAELSRDVEDVKQKVRTI